VRLGLHPGSSWKAYTAPQTLLDLGQLCNREGWEGKRGKERKCASLSSSLTKKIPELPIVLHCANDF